MNRAYSMLEVRAFDEDARRFSGVATTPSVDRVGDIIEPLGVKFDNPLPLLHQHRHDAPIGTVRFKKPTKDGIEFEAQIAKVEEPGPLKDRTDTAWGEVKYGLVRATSVGFRPIEYSFMEAGGVRYSEVEVYELSIVSIPANAEAIISTVKSIDQQSLRDAGIVDDPPPGIRGTDFPVTGETGVDRNQLDLNTVTRISKGERIALEPEIPTQPEDEGATANAVRVVKLDEPAGVSAPFIIKDIKRN